jgi:hypothetical protein
MKYLCSDCNKRFKTKKLFEKHTNICNIVSNLNKESYDKNEILKELIYTLFDKCNNLENEVYQLKNFVKKTKKQINILEWLNNNRNPKYSLKQFIENFEFTEKHLFYIFEKNYVNGMNYILNDLFDIQYINEHPICSFKQKNNTFYKYDILSKSWLIMSNKDFNEFIQKIHLKALEKFQIWYKENENRILRDQDFYNKYLTYMKNITGGNLSRDESIKRIKSKLYNYLKMNVKEIIQYEFTF